MADVFPAYAGVSPDPRYGPNGPDGLPRLRGGEPRLPVDGRVLVLSSPPTRG